MNHQLATLEKAALGQHPSSVPEGLQITHDVRLKQAQAEILSRYQMAIMFPRSWESVGAKLVMICQNPDFARTAFYSKPAGRDKVEGLSVRFAERVQQLMRNLSVECQPEMEDELSVHYRMTVTDLESNTPESETFKIDKTVERHSVAEGVTILSRRTNSKGEMVNLIPATEEQIFSKVRAMKSKIKRNLILNHVPADIRAECLALCKTIAAKEDAKNPQQAIKDIIAAFLSLGVDVPDLKEYLGHSPASLVAKEIEELRGIYALIRDGELIWNDVLEAKREQTPSGSRKAFVAEKQAARAKKKTQRAAQPRQPDPAAGSGDGGGSEGKSKGGGGKAAGGKAAAAPPPAAARRASRRGSDDEDDSKDGDKGEGGGAPTEPGGGDPPDSNDNP